VIVRPAVPGDAPALARLRWRCRTEKEEPVAETFEGFMARCEKWMAQRLGQSGRWRCWTAVDAGRTVGCVWLELLEKVPNPTSEPEEHAYVTSLYVEPGHRLAGLGGALLDAAVRECGRRGLDCALRWRTSESLSL
jgi:GNAT superfamily N-acetyltransferase